jgi:hypothetical protein
MIYGFRLLEKNMVRLPMDLMFGYLNLQLRMVSMIQQFFLG